MFIHQLLYSQGKTRYPLDRRLGDPKACVDGMEKRKLLILLGLEL
jgi:hypothetical protein